MRHFPVGNGLPISDDILERRGVSSFTRKTRDFLAIVEKMTERTRSSLPNVDAHFVRTIIKVRRMRGIFLSEKLFSDPVWDILLDLTAAKLENQFIPVSSVLIAASVPTTTALRYVQAMTRTKMLERHEDPNDGRRHFITISTATFEAMLSYLARTKLLLADSMEADAK